MALTKVSKHVINFGLGTDWVSGAKTSDFTAEAGKGYFIDTTSAVVTVTLPGSPNVGDIVELIDYSGTSGSNKIVITSSNNIEGSSDNKTLKTNYASTKLVYSGSSEGWVSSSTEGLDADIPDLTVDFLVVAGGGGGGSAFGGGGGAGGYRTSYGSTSGGGSSAESALSLAVNTSYNVTIGNGGTGGSNTASNHVTGGQGSNGQDSIFHTITSKGGGGGGSYYPSTGGSLNNGLDGGSGGGAGSDEQSNANAGGNAVTSPVVHGYDGADGFGRSPYVGAGGGGAGSVGDPPNSTSGGDGGNGLSSSITGASVARAGGGGGGAYTYANASQPGVGQAGGGNGNGAQNGSGFNATANTGSGGGGGGYPAPVSGGSGGSGVVILRYPNSKTLTASSGLTHTTLTDGADKVTTITAGTGTVTFS